MPPEVVKTYPPRGPLQQFRLASAQPLTCFRCGQDKKSKLHTIYAGDWDRRLCNGCYGELLSIYDVKAGTAPDDERADALAQILLDLTFPGVHFSIDFDVAPSSLHLSPEAERFIDTAEFVAAVLLDADGLEWSPAVIGLCKAVELEVLRLLFEPWCRQASGRDLSEDAADKNLARVAKWCQDHRSKPPELGTMAYTLAVLAGSRRRAAGALGSALRDVTRGCTDAEWLLSADGLAHELDVLREEYRNRAAHLDALDANDYALCRERVLGEKGLLARLIAAIPPTSWASD